MEIATCRTCGKVFNHVRGQLICPTCQKDLDGKFKDARKYLYDNPKTGIRELSKACEVPIAQINRWIREERLCFSDDSPVALNCEICGASIKTGRFCSSCKNNLQQGFGEAAGLNKKPEAAEKPKAPKESKIRFLDS